MNIEYTIAERAERILEAVKEEVSTDPVEIYEHVAQIPAVRIHGPEHHILDGSCVIMAYANAGGKLPASLDECLGKLSYEGQRMPGAMCGLWGACGAATSVGAALSVLEGTGPLSTEDWSSHMQYTIAALSGISSAGGPRCCKRDAFFALTAAVPYIEQRYGVKLRTHDIVCTFYPQNKQCLGAVCPFNKNHKA